MALTNRISRKAKQDKETGLGVDSRQSGGRFFQKDGKPNINIRGISFLERFSIYQYMLKIPTWKFLLLTGLAYVVVNIFFALIYFITGVHHLGGVGQQTMYGKFWEAFFFSAQTLTTVGYGHVYPSTLTGSTIAAFESLTGLMMFALGTGLMYGRFAKPKSYILFSRVALFSPFRDGYALMFRFAPFKKHFLTNVEVRVTMAMKLPDQNGTKKNNFFSLDLELSRANTLISNWTIVHPITEESPLYQLTRHDIAEAETELLVFVTGYDEEYANNVVSRGSYTADEFVYGAKFDMMYEPSPDGTSTLLHLNKIDQFHAELLPVNI